MNSTADQLIEAVAAARLALEEAAANHTEANSRAATLLARIDQCQERQQGITRRRLDGQGTQDEANEWAALNGDLAVLRELHQQAQIKAETSRPERERAALTHADAQLCDYQHQAAFDAIVDHARAAEHVYVQCLRAVLAAARDRGSFRTFGEVFLIDPAIMNLCRLNSFQGLELRP